MAGRSLKKIGGEGNLPLSKKKKRKSEQPLIIISFWDWTSRIFILDKNCHTHTHTPHVIYTFFELKLWVVFGSTKIDSWKFFYVFMGD